MAHLTLILAFAAVATSHALLLPQEGATGGKGYAVRALAVVDRLVQCQYMGVTGYFRGEGMWQSGNTIESISNAHLYTDSSRWDTILQNSFARTPVIVDQCFDDHQWWLLGWVRAFHATGNMAYLQRAAAVFDYVVNKSWTPLCGGGVIWCPTTAMARARLLKEAAQRRGKGGEGNGNGKGTGDENVWLPNGPYKNAITNELFLTSAMNLHPFATQLGRPADYYLSWALKEWRWFEASGMINKDTQLINDGLDDSCANNGQTTWTYNSGVLLSGLADLAAATSNASLLQRAQITVSAVQQHLTDSKTGVLVEPCGSSGCDLDQHLFKGIFMRHLGYLTQQDPHSAALFNDFILTNAASLLASDACSDGGYGEDWRGPCSGENTASSSSALDLLLAASKAAPTSSPSVASSWEPLGLGNCADASMQSMANCFRTGVSEAACQAQAQADARAVAYDIETSCLGNTFCRVRTLGGAAACPSGWTWEAGSATTITTSTNSSLAICVLKTA